VAACFQVLDRLLQGFRALLGLAQPGLLRGKLLPSSLQRRRVLLAAAACHAQRFGIRRPLLVALGHLGAQRSQFLQVRLPDAISPGFDRLRVKSPQPVAARQLLSSCARFRWFAHLSSSHTLAALAWQRTLPN
jgi:hypothetical protein